MRLSNFKPALTIVELLIVVVVLAVVATISIVAYGNMQRSAVTMMVQRTAAEA